MSHPQERLLPLRVWQREGTERFGKDPNRWLFKCPSCGQVQTRADLDAICEDKKLVEWSAGYTCIGALRRLGNPLDRRVVSVMQPTQGFGCVYEGGLSNNFSPVLVTIREPDENLENGVHRPTFEWADPEPEPCWKCNGDGVYCWTCGERDVGCQCDEQNLGDCDECAES